MCGAPLQNSAVQIPTKCQHTHSEPLQGLSRDEPTSRKPFSSLPVARRWDPLVSVLLRVPPSAGRLPRRGGAGGGRPLPGGGPGAGRGAGGAGGGAGRAGAGVSLPPSLSPVKSRGAAGLSPVSSSCSLGRAAVTVHRRRRGLHRRVRPPPAWPPQPPAPASPTTTSSSRSSASTAARCPPRPPTLPPPPGRYAAPRPAPRPCTGRCSAPSARPTPNLSRLSPPGPP